MSKYCSQKDSDGYHTFEELYEHRAQLFALIVNTPQYNKQAWKSWKHNDGTMYSDYFIVGITNYKGEHYSYHYHKDYWDMFGCKVVERAPEYDGHKPEDFYRLHSMNIGSMKQLCKKGLMSSSTQIRLTNDFSKLPEDGEYGEQCGLVYDPIC